MPFTRSLVPWFILWRSLSSPVAFGVQAMLENDSGEVLLVRQSYASGWALPGGGVNRGEPPAEAIVRELREEVGLVRCDPPVLIALYTRRFGIATNVVALYHVKGAELAFKPNLEIREICFADPSHPPDGARDGVRRRFAELTGKAARTPYW